MKIKSTFIGFATIVAAVLFSGAALASTYVWVGDVSKLNETKPRLVQTSKNDQVDSTCVYASHGFKSGDVLVLEDIKVTMVCARTSDGAAWLHAKPQHP